MPGENLTVTVLAAVEEEIEASGAFWSRWRLAHSQVDCIGGGVRRCRRETGCHQAAPKGIRSL
jgi:hypothetical protein